MFVFRIIGIGYRLPIVIYPYKNKGMKKFIPTAMMYVCFCATNSFYNFLDLTKT